MKDASTSLLQFLNQQLFLTQPSQIEYTKAQVIARVKDNEKRQNILKKALEENLSLSAIKELVGDILQTQSEGKPQSSQQQNKERTSKIYKALIKSKIWDDEKKVKKVNRLFDQIEALLEEKKEDAS